MISKMCRRALSGLLVIFVLLSFTSSVFAAPSVIATISFGSSRAGAIGANPTTNRVYAAQEDLNRLAVIDGATNSILTTVATLGFHAGVAVHPGTNRIYVAHQFAGNVRIIDGATNTIVTDLAVPGLVHTVGDLAINSVTNRLYVIRMDNNDVAVFDSTTNTFLTAIAGGTLSLPNGIAVNSITNRIYVSSANTNQLIVVDGASNLMLATIPVGNRPTKIAVNPVTNRIYVTNINAGTVSVIDGATNTVVATVPVGTAPVGAAVNSNTNRIYIPNNSSNTVSVIDGNTNTVVSTVSVGAQPSFAAAIPSTNRIYVSQDTAHSVVVIEDVVTHLTLNPANTNLAVGANTTLNIDLNNVANLYGYQFQVNYDATKVSAVGAFVNTWFDTTTDAIVPAGWNATCASGVCKFAASKTNPATPLTGSGRLAQITFTGIAPGTGAVTFSGSVLADRNGASITHSTGNGSIVVYGAATVTGQVNLQGRATPGDAFGTVMFIDASGFFSPLSVNYSAAGAYSASLPARSGGTSYNIVAAHSLYLSNRDTGYVVNPGDTLTKSATTLKGGDANNDAAIEIGDLTCIGGAFGGGAVVCGTTGSSDINADSTTNILDLVLAGGNYGLASPLPW